MIKVIMPMRRREGMTIDEFREYYETKHRIIGEKYLTGYATKYIRRFTNPLPDRSGKVYDPDFDVLMEIWYPDMETFEKCAENLQKPEIKKEINDDEEKIFDLSLMRTYIVEEHESKM